MSPEAQRIAIAEACGWKRNIIYDTQARDIISWLHPSGRLVFANLPDYLNDLNAMHEAEKALTPEQAGEYHRQLMLHPEPCGWMWHISANRKAGAFLRCLGKWEESP